MNKIKYSNVPSVPPGEFRLNGLQTNADRIRAMSDEELAEFLILSPEMEFELCRYCANGNTAPDDRGQCLRPNGHCYANDRCEAFKKWLKQEADNPELGGDT